jgi:sugar phosphate isomerase/epimerase
MPGDGCIDNRKIRTWMEREGFKGPVEVEIFSAFDWWLRPSDEMVKTICDRLEFL